MTNFRRLALALAVFAAAAAADARTKITILHFSDYHSHALPFYSEDRAGQGGMARAVAVMRREKARGAVIFSGGDMLNAGSPAWSDKYGCAEWPWLNGLVDAMAFGNHDPDYGFADYVRCRDSVRYPILSANTAGMQQYEVFTRGGVKIGVFAVAGPDFPSLVKAKEFAFGDRIAAAREVVRTLREVEHCDAVILIGHEHLDDDFALARAVPGIDVILGSHSHLKREWQRIPDTQTWFISPFQYLTYISRVVLTFDGHKLVAAMGTLERIDASRGEEKAVARRVAAMQRELERDPKYAALFTPIGELKQAMSVDELGAFTVDTMRRVANADLALSTTSSFRQPLPAGTLTQELLRAAMPYDNELVVVRITGAQLQQLRDHGGEAAAWYLTPGALDPARTYRVATTDYFARVAKLDAEKTGTRVRTEVAKSLAK